MHLYAIPTSAFDLHFVGSWRVRGYKDCADVDAGDQFVGGELVVGGVTRSAHKCWLTMPRQLYGWYSG